jgi:alpha-1,6-mannosyltransferase
VAPLVVLGARDRAAALAGAAAAGAAALSLVVAVFGAALPAVGLQGRLVTPLSIPNLGGVLAGHGGADPAVRTAGRHVLIAVVVAACATVTVRRRLAVPAIGVVLVAALLTIAWVMPWYLAWSLPFAGLVRRRRAVVPGAALLCVWLAIGAGAQLPAVLHAAGYHPTRTTTGLLNHDLETELVR